MGKFFACLQLHFPLLPWRPGFLMICRLFFVEICKISMTQGRKKANRSCILRRISV